jgi:hypothetical protein
MICKFFTEKNNFGLWPVVAHGPLRAHSPCAGSSVKHAPFAACWTWPTTRQRLLMSPRTRWETPRGRYDKHNSKFSLSMKPKFNRLVGERNHLWRLLLAGARNSWWRGIGASSNMEPAHNATKILCSNLQWGWQSHWFAENKGLNIPCGRRCLFAVK